MHAKTRRPPASQAAMKSGRSTSPGRPNSDLRGRTSGLPTVGRMSALPMTIAAQKSFGLRQAGVQFRQLSPFHAATAERLHSRRLIGTTRGHLADEIAPL